MGNIPESIGNLTNLRLLYLNNTQLTGEIPGSIGNLTSAVQIHLQNNQLSGEVPESIGNLTNTSQIHLQNNQLSGSIPESIGNLTSLNHLALNDNQLTGNIPDSFGNLTNVNFLWLNNNQLTGNVPVAIVSRATVSNNFLANVTNQNSLTYTSSIEEIELDIGESIDLLPMIGNERNIAFSPTLEWVVSSNMADIVSIDGTTIIATNYGRIDVTVSIKGSAETGNDNAKLTFPVWVRSETPTLTVTNPIELELGETLDYLQGVQAFDYRGNDITSAIEWDNNNIDTSTKGIHIISYSVEDRGYTVSQQRVVIVGDYTVGNRFIYDIQDFMVFKEDINGSNDELIEKSKVAAWYVETGLPVDNSLLEVKNHGGYQPQVGEYTFEIGVRGETEDVAVATVEVVSRNIEVSVPVKLMFASFASDGGTVTAPEYEIVNHSSLPIDVSLSSFDEQDAAGLTLVQGPPQNDNELQLQLLGGTNFSTNIDLPREGHLGRLARNNEVASNGTFTFGGKYRGRFGTPREPRFQAVFQFELILPEGLE